MGGWPNNPASGREPGPRWQGRWTPRAVLAAHRAGERRWLVFVAVGACLATVPVLGHQVREASAQPAAEREPALDLRAEAGLPDTPIVVKLRSDK